MPVAMKSLDIRFQSSRGCWKKKMNLNANEILIILSFIILNINFYNNNK